MRSMQKGCACAAVAFALAGFTSAYGADIQVRDRLGGENPYGGSPGYYVTGTSSGGHSIGTVIGGSDVKLFGGMFDLEADYLDGNGWTPLRTYCIQPDMSNHIQTQPPDTIGLTFEIVPLDSLDGITSSEEDFLETLWANAFDMSAMGATTVEKTKNAHAFQVIVWELRQDDTIDFTGPAGPTNRFRLDTSDPFTAEVVATATQWVDNITGGVWTQRVPLYGLYNEFSQDIVTTVPEPSSALLLLVGLALLRKRR